MFRRITGMYCKVSLGNIYISDMHNRYKMNYGKTNKNFPVLAA